MRARERWCCSTHASQCLHCQTTLLSLDSTVRPAVLASHGIPSNVAGLRAEDEVPMEQNERAVEEEGEDDYDDADEPVDGKLDDLPTDPEIVFLRLRAQELAARERAFMREMGVGDGAA